jgi:hypothetical protein
MNISTKLQRTWLIGIAAITLTGSGLVGSSASAKTDTIDGGGASTRVASSMADFVTEFVTERKIALAQDRIDRAWLYR